MSSTSSSFDGEKRKMARKKRKQKKSVAAAGPIVPPPHRLIPSRKRARKMTTEFHKLLKEQQEAENKVRDDNDDQHNTASLQQVQDQIEKSRADYQRASQVSTSFHSTSKWVLGVLAQNGRLYGRKIVVNDDDSKDDDQQTKRKRKKQKRRRPTRLLEIGAINTELLDAATASIGSGTQKMNDDIDKYSSSECHDNGTADAKPPAQRSDGRLLHVRAIDIHSMDPRIEEADFLTLPNDSSNASAYDVIVCSMVLNCGMTPQQRGEFLRKMYHFLQPDGLLFLTLPRTCLQLSPFMDQTVLKQMLEHVGLPVTTTKESPKIAFLVCTKQQQQPPPSSSAQRGAQNDDQGSHTNSQANNSKWAKLTRIRRGKKYRNDFAIVLAPSKDNNDDGSKQK